MTLRLWEEWKRLIFYKSEEGKALDLDGTNNGTERAIGRCGKIRYKMMRGYKSRESWKLTHELCKCTSPGWGRKEMGTAWGR